MRSPKRFFLYLIFLVFFYFLLKSTLNYQELSNPINQESNQPHDYQQPNDEQKTCGRFPEKDHINVDNVIWKILELQNGFVKILNAYLDLRQEQSIVRVNVNSIDLEIERDQIYCQFWFEGSESSEPQVTLATEFTLMWFECEFELK
jgi:hypothetical protein